MPRALAPRLSLAVLAILAVAGAGAPAFAHVGDHSRMTIAEMADHLFSSLDHRFAITAVVLVLALAGVSALLAYRKRGRSPERSAI